MSLLNAALAYARAGRAVLPCRPRGKAPTTSRGLHDATVDEAKIRAWWTRWPDANIGIACGALSGFWAVDVDPRNDGGTTWSAIVEKYGPLPETREAATGGGGWHYLWRWPTTGAAALWRGSLGGGVDVKASGYILVAPSIHPSGAAYAWANAAPLADAPAWLLELATRPIVVPSAPIGVLRPERIDRFIAAAIDGECKKVAQASRGERNCTLNRAAFAIGGLLAVGLERAYAESVLMSAALAAGLAEYESHRTIASGLDGGARHPRQIPERRAA